MSPRSSLQLAAAPTPPPGSASPVVGCVPARAASAEQRPLNLLTIFRFAAALWVILFHLQDMFWLPFPGWSMHLVRNGAYAMSFFFILSGTVLAYSYRDLTTSRADLKRFYLSRFARIYPVYLLIHIIGLVWLPVPFSNLPRWGYINATSILGVQAWFPPAFTGINAGTWSVSCEFFFYLIFPAALPLLRHLDTPALRLRTATYLVLFIGFLGLADFAFERGGTFPLVYISPLCRLPEFLLGVIIGLSLHSRPPTRPLRGFTVFCSAAFMLLLSCNTAHHAGLWIRANIVIVPAVAWLIYTSARYEISRPDAFKRGIWMPLEYLGRASYCMFLVQMPILLWLPRAHKAQQPLAVAMADNPEVAFVGTTLAIIALGIIAHELIEKPARRWIIRRCAPSMKTA